MRHNGPSNSIIIAGVLLLVIFNVVRIFTVPITHDEGITFKEYTSQSYSDIAACAHPSANNQILNTLLTKFTIEHANSSSFFLRLNGLLGQLLYLLISYLLLAFLFIDRKWVVAGFILLTFNPFLLQFWGLCRGYSLAIGFMMGSVFFLLSYFKSGKYYSLLLALLFAISSVYSNFSLLNFFAAIIVAVVFYSLFFRRPTAAKTLLFKELPAIIIALAVLYILISVPIVKLEKAGQFYYGGQAGFMDDTVRSVVADYFFIDNPQIGLVTLLSYLVVAAFILMGIYWARLFISKKEDKDITWGIITWLLVAVIVFSTIIQHKILGTRFLISRTALFLVPLFLLQLLCFLINIKGRLRYLLLMAKSGLAILNFFINLNFHTAWSWRFDRYDLQVIERINKENKRSPRKISVRAYWWFAPSFQYYTSTRFSDKFYPVEHLKSDFTGDTTYDYYYALKNNINDIPLLYKVDTVYGDEYFLLRKK